MKKIWITGAEGHIGTALLELLEGVEYQLLPTDIIIAIKTAVNAIVLTIICNI